MHAPKINYALTEKLGGHYVYSHEDEVMKDEVMSISEEIKPIALSIVQFILG